VERLRENTPYTLNPKPLNCTAALSRAQSPNR